MPAPKGAARATLRPARFEDFSQIDSVLRTNGLPGYTESEWTQFWLRNPVYKALNGKWEIGWVLEKSGGQLAGTIGAVPLAYEFRGRPIGAAACIGWAVEPAYRAWAMALLGRVASQPGVELLVSTTTGPDAIPALAARGYVRPPVGRWDTCAFWITNYGGFVRSWLRRPTARPSVRQVLRLPRRFAASSTPSAGVPEAAWSGGFDGRFDSFWEKLRRDKHEVLLPVRSREILEWRFDVTRQKNGLWVLTVPDRGDLVAYAVLERRDNPALGLKRVRIADCQFLDRARDLCGSLLAAAIERCRAEGIHVLEDCGCWFEGPGYLNRPAPFHRPIESWAYYAKATTDEIATALGDPGCWNPTSFDGDASL